MLGSKRIILKQSNEVQKVIQVLQTEGTSSEVALCCEQTIVRASQKLFHLKEKLN